MSQPRQMPLDWWPIKPIHIAATTTDQQFITRGGRLFGWSFEETTASAGATCSLIDGTTSGGQTIVPISLIANQSTRDIWGKPGIEVGNGVLLHMFAGSVRATIYFLGLSEEEIIRQAGYQLPE